MKYLHLRSLGLRGSLVGLALMFSVSCMAGDAQPAMFDFPDTPYGEVRIKEFPIAVQAWTFRRFTFMETLEMVKELGIENIEAWPGQRLGLPGVDPEALFAYNMSSGQIEAVKAALERFDLRVVAYGVVDKIGPDELEELFSFAKEMGIEIVVMEPSWDDWTGMDELAREKGLKVAVHNYAVPSKYARPETVLSHIEGLSRRIGACADMGHWLRSGVVPTEGLKLLSDRINDVHLKDLVEIGNQAAEEVPFGQGAADARAVLAELTKQNYAGYLTIEYENEADADDPRPAIRKIIEFIDSVTYYKGWTEILGSSNGRFSKHGWNHYGPGYFSLDSYTGVLTAHGGMGLFWHTRKYKDFMLEMEFLVEEDKDNSGIFYRVPDMPISDDYIYHAFEVQIDGASDDMHRTGAVYDAVAPSADAKKGAGRWNHYRITLRGSHITVELNGGTVVEWEMQPSGKIRDFAAEGYIGLQNHDNGSPVHFRNIFIREL